MNAISVRSAEDRQRTSVRSFVLQVVRHARLLESAARNNWAVQYSSDTVRDSDVKIQGHPPADLI